MFLMTVPRTSEGSSNSFDRTALTLAGIPLIGASSCTIALPQINDRFSRRGTPTCSNFTQHINLKLNSYQGTIPGRQSFPLLRCEHTHSWAIHSFRPAV